MTDHIKMIICKRLLKDEKRKALAKLKPRSKKLQQDEHDKLFEAVINEVKAIDADLWVLENW